jgi:hypothetical protein
MSHQDLSRLLNSEKATYRKRGKDELEKLMKSDVEVCCIANCNWWEVLGYTLQWEQMELQHNLKRSTQLQALYMNVSVEETQ